MRKLNSPYALLTKVLISCTPHLCKQDIQNKFGWVWSSGFGDRIILFYGLDPDKSCSHYFQYKMPTCYYHISILSAYFIVSFYHIRCKSKCCLRLRELKLTIVVQSIQNTFSPICKQHLINPLVGKKVTR